VIREEFAMVLKWCLHNH